MIRANMTGAAPGSISGEGLDVVIESPLWERAGLEPAALAAAAVGAAAAALAEEGVQVSARPLAVVFADDGLLRRLNAQFRGKDAPTNVLAFPAIESLPTDEGKESPLGDVVLSFETIEREALAHGIPLADRVAHMIVHGFLHLRGFDHETDDEALKMETMERTSLARLGLPDPYEVDAHA